MGQERSVEMDDHHTKIHQHVKDLDDVKKTKLDKQVRLRAEIDK